MHNQCSCSKDGHTFEFKLNVKDLRVIDNHPLPHTHQSNIILGTPIYESFNCKIKLKHCCIFFFYFLHNEKNGHVQVSPSSQISQLSNGTKNVAVKLRECE